MQETELPCVIVAEPIDEQVLVRLRREARVIQLPDSSPEQLLRAIPNADALLVRNRTHLTARILNAAQRLRVIGRAGASLDHIDVRAVRRRNIALIYTPRALVQPVAEHTLALILAAVRRVVWFDRRIREGMFDTLRLPTGRRLSGLTFGLLGAGAVAAEVARILREGFKADVIAHAPRGVERSEPAAEEVDFENLLRRSDVLSIHMPQSRDHSRIINEAAFGQMKFEALLINTSRGSTVDYNDLAEALKTSRIAGAAIDVFDAEPLPAAHPLRTAPHCILTPHVASLTVDVNEELHVVADDILLVLRGQAPRTSTMAMAAGMSE